MSKLSNLLVLLSLVTSNIYTANSYTLTASVLNQKGYNDQSYDIRIPDSLLDNIDPNAFIGYNNLKRLDILTNSITAFDLESLKGAVNIDYLRLYLPSMNKFTNSKNVKFPYLTELTITYNNLTSFNKPMFNAFPALKLFSTGDFYQNGTIKTVDAHTFESLSNLTKIDLHRNSITSFEYLQIPKNLKTLNLAGNKMNYFALSRTMGVLDYLDISFNLFRSFKSMDFTFLANLTYLDLSSNPHAYPNEFSGHMKPLVKLEHVELVNLNISTIDSNFFKTNTKLVWINLIGNIINSLDNTSLIYLTDLQTILLRYNKLTKISSGTFLVSNNPNLTNLDLRDNQISQIDKSSFYGNLQTHAVLSNNQLTNFPPKAFEGEFASIDLSYNQIAEIDNLMLDGITKTTVLILSSNQIESIAAGSFSNLVISSLYLDKNLLSEINTMTFAGLRELNKLDLSYNKIEKIEPGTFNNICITDLRLSGNRLTELKNLLFSGLGGIRNLDLLGNMIENIEPGSFNNVDFTNMTDILLSGNRLVKLVNMTFTGVRELNKLDFSSNKIEEIEAGAFNNVDIVSEVCFDKNRLTALRNTMFAGLNRIKLISLTDNNISTIETGTFAGLQSLENVVLINNQLTQLDSSIFAGSNNLLGIYLNGNPNLSTDNIQSLCPPAATQCKVYY